MDSPSGGGVRAPGTVPRAAESTRDGAGNGVQAPGTVPRAAESTRDRAGDEAAPQRAMAAPPAGDPRWCPPPGRTGGGSTQADGSFYRSRCEGGIPWPVARGERAREGPTPQGTRLSRGEPSEAALPRASRERK